MKKLFFLILTAAAAVSLSAAPITPAPYQKGDWREKSSISMTKRASKLKHVQVVFFGDSITQGWTMHWVKVNGLKAWNKEFGKIVSKYNFGLSKDKVENVHWRITEGKQLDGYKTKVIVLMIGVNNIMGKNSNTPEEVAEGIKNLLAVMKQKQPQAKILLLGLTPVSWDMKKYKEVNNLICKFGDEKTVFYRDFSGEFLTKEGTTQKLKDGLHFSEEGFFAMAAKLRPELEKLLQAGPAKK